MASLFGCQMSPRGGSVVRNEGFKIVVPTFNTEVQQGELQTVTISLHRESLFQQDVELDIEAADGISIDPDSVTIKASQKPDVQLQIAAAKDANLGEYPVVVKATPKTGEPTSVTFTVKVTAP